MYIASSSILLRNHIHTLAGPPSNHAGLATFAFKSRILDKGLIWFENLVFWELRALVA